MYIISQYIPMNEKVGFYSLYMYSNMYISQYSIYLGKL